MAEVSIREAADTLGVSIDTIRRRIGKGTLSAHKVPTQRGMTWRVQLLGDAPADAHAPAHANGHQVQALQETIEILKIELEARRREISELHVLMQGRALSSGSRPWWRRLVSR